MTKSKAITYTALILMGILLIAAIRGCQKAKQETGAKEKAQLIADSTLNVLRNYKAHADSTEKAYRDSLEFSNGQLALAKEQALRSDINLQGQVNINRVLLAKYKLSQYADTTATTTVPREFLADCEGCFVNLEKTTGLVERYRTDINNLELTQEKQNIIYQNRFKELNEERLGFYNKMNSLAKEQQKALDKLKPHGRLYLSWGVLWSPYPIAGGAGLLYQNKYNLLYGAKWYYGKYGHMVETTLNFPLSLKFK